ncbi:MAG TPA: DUF6600 domain-containing protein, partial [Bryobacteraceae bacterium]|nr:DUF6600 domain-containing protein [Bryobacteraceae bacterium]
MRCQTGSWKPVLLGATLYVAGSLLVFGQAYGQEDEVPEGSQERGVARISLINGDVSVRRGDSGDWVAGAVNAPMVVEDSVATGAGSRAELQFDYANVARLIPDTEVRISDLQYHRYQLQLARGTVIFRVLRNTDAQVEIATPVISVRPTQQGIYRISVLNDGQVEVTTRAGNAEIYTPRGVEQLQAGQTMMARNGPNGAEFQLNNAPGGDEWDRWSDGRDQALQRATSYRYVNPDVYGAEDLDPYGQWVYAPDYGYVWSPRVGPDWAPYRAGRWAWLDWYGWTWVSADPWGWAPYHYGRWFYSGPRGWCWYPGPLRQRAYWSPALVAFFGFGGGGGVHVGVGFGFGNVGWVPLAPREPFHPWWGGRYYGGYRNVHVTNVNVTNVNITNVYRNARVANGMTGMNARDFGAGHFSNRNMMRVSGNQIGQAGLVRGQLPVAPGNRALQFSDRQVSRAPRSVGGQQHFFSRSQPQQVQRVPFAQQQRAMQQMQSRAPVTNNPGASGFRGGANAPGRPGANGYSNTLQQRSTPGAGANTSGWRRFEGGTPNAGGARQAMPSAPVDRGNRQNGGQRMNQPGARSGNPGEAPRMQQSAPAPGNRGGNNWQRFGTPSGGFSPRSERAPQQQQRMQAPNRTAPQEFRG